jgi:hypothetical protein
MAMGYLSSHFFAFASASISRARFTWELMNPPFGELCVGGGGCEAEVIVGVLVAGDFARGEHAGNVGYRGLSGGTN